MYRPQKLILLLEEENINESAELLSQVHPSSGPPLDPLVATCFALFHMTKALLHVNVSNASLAHIVSLCLAMVLTFVFFVQIQLKELLKFINPEYLSGFHMSRHPPHSFSN